MRLFPVTLIDDIYDYRCMRLLVVIKILSYSSRKNPILNIEKLKIFDFLIDKPYILNKLLRQLEKHKKEIILQNYDIDNIKNEYININDIYRYKTTKKILSILMASNFVNVEVIKNETMYVITKCGNMIVERMESEHINELIIIGQAMLPLISLSHTKLYQMIRVAVEEN